MALRHRSRTLIKRQLGLVVALGVLASSPLSADILEMRTGARMEGRILSEVGDSIQFETLQRVELTIPKSTVSEVVRQPAHTFHERLAEMARKAGRFDEAVAQLEEAIKAGGDQDSLSAKIEAIRAEAVPQASAQFAARLDDARHAMSQGRLEDAERQLRSVKADAPASDRGTHEMVAALLSYVLSEQAHRLVDSVNYTQAERVLREALELAPNDHYVAAQLAEVLSRNPLKRQEAVNLFRTAIAQGGDAMPAHDRNQMVYSLGRLYRDMGDHVNAVRYLRAVYQADPKFRSDLSRDLVASLVAFGQTCEPSRRELAIRSAQEALAINSRSAEARLLLASNLMELGRNEEAVETLTPLAEQDNRRRGVNQMIAQALLREGNVTRARTHLERELQLNGQNYEVLCDLADLDLNAGMLDEARARLERAQAIDERNPRAILGLARVEREAENYSQALAHVRRVLDALPDHLAGNLELGYVQRDQFNYEAAAEAFGRVVQILEERRSDDYEWRKQMADALVAQGEVRLLTTGPGTATRDFNRALEVLPDYALAYYSIGEAYKRKYADSKQLDDLRLAEQNMLRAREIEPGNPEFAFGLGVLYQQVMAAADSGNSQEYLQKAVEHYEAYIDSGGGQVETVRGWIRESGGEVGDLPS
jgi:tetratricopeptide (TPR) repeat protein